MALPDDITQKIDTIARDLAETVASGVIDDLHRQGIYDTVAEESFRALALDRARRSVVDGLRERLAISSPSA